jgi:hypothetical protein
MTDIKNGSLKLSEMAAGYPGAVLNENGTCNYFNSSIFLSDV